MVRSACPSCGTVADREPYDIGSGPELSCANCEWCWGAHGQDLAPVDNPFMKPITDVKAVRPQRSGGVVVLERIEPGVTPEYCVHGKVTCYGCDEWCWLGDQTHDIVASGEAAPLCLQCAEERLPKNARPDRRLNDHRRKDGPHE